MSSITSIVFSRISYNIYIFKSWGCLKSSCIGMRAFAIKENYSCWAFSIGPSSNITPIPTIPNYTAVCSLNRSSSCDRSKYNFFLSSISYSTISSGCFNSINLWIINCSIRRISYKL